MSKTHSNYWFRHQLSCTIMVFCSISIQYALSFTYLRSFGWRACCGLEEAETCRTRSKPTGNCKDRLICTFVIIFQTSPLFSFFERLRPAADSALSVPDSYPQFEFEKYRNFHFRCENSVRTGFLLTGKEMIQCFARPSMMGDI